MKKLEAILLIVLPVLAVALVVLAKLPPSDNAVLSRVQDLADTLWGWAAAGWLWLLRSPFTERTESAILSKLAGRLTMTDLEQKVISIAETVLVNAVKNYIANPSQPVQDIEQAIINEVEVLLGITPPTPSPVIPSSPAG